jgi:hypothetical protein
MMSAARLRQIEAFTDHELVTACELQGFVTELLAAVREIPECARCGDTGHCACFHDACRVCGSKDHGRHSGGSLAAGVSAAGKVSA